MPRPPMYTPVEPIALDSTAYPADHWIGVVARLDAQFGRRPGTLGQEDEGAGFARDVYEIKKRLGRMPGTHGVDDEGDGIARHVFEQRTRMRRANGAALATAFVALVTAAASALTHYADARPRELPAAAPAK